MNNINTTEKPASTQHAIPSAPVNPDKPSAGDGLYTFHFVLNDGTIVSVRAHDRIEAAHIANM